MPRAVLLISTQAAMYIDRLLGYGLKIIFLFHCLFVSAQVNGDVPSFFVYVENGLQGVKDEQNDVIIPATYEQIGWTDSGFEFHEGVTGYRENGLWGLISKENERLTEPVYTELSLSGSGIYIKAKKRVWVKDWEYDSPLCVYLYTNESIKPSTAAKTILMIISG